MLTEFDELAALRQRIHAIETKRRTVMAERRTKTGAAELVDRHIDAIALAEARVEALFDPRFEPGRGHALATFESVEQLAATLLPKEYRRFLLSRLEIAAEGQPPGISEAARAKALEKLAGELAELERSEEELVRALELRGLDVDRRADASPDVVLGIELGPDTDQAA